MLCAWTDIDQQGSAIVQQVYEYQPYKKKTSTNVEFVLIPLENSEKENIEDRPQGSLSCVSLKFYVCSYVTTDNIKYQSSPSLSRKNSDNITLAIFFTFLYAFPAIR